MAQSHSCNCPYADQPVPTQEQLDSWMRSLPPGALSSMQSAGAAYNPYYNMMGHPGMHMPSGAHHEHHGPGQALAWLNVAGKFFN